MKKLARDRHVGTSTFISATTEDFDNGARKQQAAKASDQSCMEMRRGSKSKDPNIHISSKEEVEVLKRGKFHGRRNG